jgi:hypothetical protein
MWESSVPINNDNINITFGTNNNSNRQLINSSSNKIYDQGFQTCRSLINHFDSQLSDDDAVFSDEEDQGGITPKASKRKGPNSFVLQLNVQNIHLAANAPSVIIKSVKI